MPWPAELRSVAGGLARRLAARLPVGAALGLFRLLSPFARVPPPVWRIGAEGLGLEGRALARWQRRAWWGSAASRTVKDRLRDDHDRGIDRVLLPVDWAPLERALARGRGAILVGGHVGPGGVVPWALARRFPDVLALLSVDGGARPAGVHDVRGEESRATSLAAARLVLRRGGIVYVPPDGPRGAACAERTLLGVRVRIGEGAPALARVCGAPTLPACALWQGARIRVELGDEIPADAWLDGYFAWLERHLRGPAENLQIDGGGWR